MKLPSLKTILSHYEETLCDKLFSYELNHKWQANLVFYREDFCHLVGLHHVYGRDKRYLGINGYRRVVSGEITVESIKKHNMKSYGFIKDRLLYFDCIHELLTGGTIYRFYADRVKPHTVIVADMVMRHDGRGMLLHLFLRKENDLANQYAPVSFIVKSPKDKNQNQFIAGQEAKIVTGFSVTKTTKAAEALARRM